MILGQKKEMIGKGMTSEGQIFSRQEMSVAIKKLKENKAADERGVIAEYPKALAVEEEEKLRGLMNGLRIAAVVKDVQCHERNVVLDGRPPPISNSEKELTRKERSTLAQLRSGYCRLLGSYKSRIKKDANLDVCADCGTTPHDVKHFFVCPAHPTTLI